MKKQTIEKIRLAFGIAAFVSLVFSLGTVGAIELETIKTGVGFFRVAAGIGAFGVFSYLAGLWA